MTGTIIVCSERKDLLQDSIAGFSDEAPLEPVKRLKLAQLKLKRMAQSRMEGG